jgi:hypothetical protein
MTTQTAWSKTIAAAKAEQGSAWTMILAYADDAYERDATYKDATSGLTIHELRKALLAEGVDLAQKTLETRAIVAVNAHRATPADRDVLTSVGWSIVAEFAKASWTADESAQAVRECRAGGGTPTKRWALDLLGYGRTGAATPHTITDDDARHTISALMTQRRAAETGAYTPSATILLLWQLAGEVLCGTKTAPTDWDAEAAALFDQAEGANE